jgi:hypothetical protein
VISSFTVIPARPHQRHIGFEALGRATRTPPKSAMRMFGPRKKKAA